MRSANKKTRQLVRAGAPRILIIYYTTYGESLELMKGIFKFAKLYGPWNIQLIQGGWSDPMPRTRAGLTWYDGIIAGPHFLHFADELRSCGKPIVLIDPLETSVASGMAFSRVPRTMDDGDATGQLAADYFLKAGCRNFAYLGMELNLAWSVKRGAAFAERLARHGQTCQFFKPGKRVAPKENDGAALAQWLRGLPKPVAVFVASDPRARQLAGICEACGFKIPEDVAILGVDDDQLLCEGTVPSLSSIKMNYEAKGFAAAEMLDALLMGRRPKWRVFRYGPLGVTERESTDFSGLLLPSAVKQVRDAIRVNFRSNMTISRLLARLHLPRRSTEMQFRKATGHSILEAIHIERLNLVEKLLRETDLSLTEIADKSGFTSETYLRSIFKERRGMTLGEFRRLSRDDLNLL